jgi:heme/copper-type cytochrome/quinol oxidase subunit 2
MPCPCTGSRLVKKKKWNFMILVCFVVVVVVVVFGFFSGLCWRIRSSGGALVRGIASVLSVFFLPLF